MGPPGLGSSGATSVIDRRPCNPNLYPRGDAGIRPRYRFPPPISGRHRLVEGHKMHACASAAMTTTSTTIIGNERWCTSGSYPEQSEGGWHDIILGTTPMRSSTHQARAAGRHRRDAPR